MASAPPGLIGSTADLVLAHRDGSLLKDAFAGRILYSLSAAPDLPCKLANPEFAGPSEPGSLRAAPQNLPDVSRAIYEYLEEIDFRLLHGSRFSGLPKVGFTVIMVRDRLCMLC